MPVRKHDVKPSRRLPAAALDQLIARAHKQRLVRARIRYSVLTRLAADESRRQLQAQP